MKKIIKPILILIFSVFIINNVQAYEESHIIDKVNNKEAFLLCEYKDSNNLVRARLYYVFQLNKTDGVIGTGADMYPWQFFYYDEHFKKMGNFHNNSAGSFKSLFIDSGNLYNYNADGKTFAENKEQSFTCPNYINIEYDWTDRVCFSDKEKCNDNGTIFERNAKLNDDANTIFNEIKKFSEEEVYKKLTVDDATGDTTTEENVKKKTKEYIAEEIIKKYDMNILSGFLADDTFIGNQLKDKYKYKAAPFLDNFVTHLAENIDPENNEAYNDYRNSGIKELQNRKKVLENLLKTVTNEEEKKEIQKAIEEIDKKIAKFEENTPTTYFAKTAQTKIDLNLPPTFGATDCSGLLGPNVSTIITNIFKTVQYAGPILVILLTILDFVKAASSGEADDMKKASNKLVKRLIAAILLFFVPLLCDMLLDFAGITTSNNCTFR